MSEDLRDRTGAAVRVEMDQPGPLGSYAVLLAEGGSAGRAFFLEDPAHEDERIFFHTEVDSEHGGRGLAMILVREALADTARRGLTVVPVCPLVSRYLKEHGEEYVADGGRFRRPVRADLALVRNAISDT